MPCALHTSIVRQRKLMPIYIAMLRGVNVGRNSLKMERLREICEDLGFKNARTYVQSGNVVFEAKAHLELAWKVRAGACGGNPASSFDHRSNASRVGRACRPQSIFAAARYRDREAARDLPYGTPRNEDRDLLDRDPGGRGRIPPVRQGDLLSIARTDTAGRSSPTTSSKRRSASGRRRAIGMP